MSQIITRVDDGMLAAVDELIAAGVLESRSAAVRAALSDLIDRHRRAATAKAIVDGYRAHPQAEAEMGWADAATEAMIAEEPW